MALRKKYTPLHSPDMEDENKEVKVQTWSSCFDNCITNYYRKYITETGNIRDLPFQTAELLEIAVKVNSYIRLEYVKIQNQKIVDAACEGIPSNFMYVKPEFITYEMYERAMKWEYSGTG